MKSINLKISIAALMIFTLAISCQKVVDLKLNNETGRLVIEGNITNVNGTQTVKLSRNVSFYSPNSYPAVSGATVKLKDAIGHVYSLNETQPGTYASVLLKGQRGNTYTLSVSVNGENYTASSTMPNQVMIDSLTYENDEFSTDDRKNIVVYYTDPRGVNNYYRFVEYVNNAEVRETFAYDDTFNDGQQVGVVLRQDDIKIYSGNTVRVEMQCLDKPIFTYWFSLRQQQIAGGMSGVTPADPPSNLSNNALGYFSAHTTQIKTITIK